MSKLNIAPTKSNLLSQKENLSVSKNGYDLLEQKREILVMELMRLVDKVKFLEQDIDKVINTAYPSLRKMLMKVGGDRVEAIARAVKYDFKFTQKSVTIGGMNFSTVDVELPQKELFYSSIGTYSSVDEVVSNFFELLKLLTEMAGIRTIAWRLAGEVKKTQPRVNALDKLVIPQAEETVRYIESVLEERERENVFVLKALKNRNGK